MQREWEKGKDIQCLTAFRVGFHLFAFKKGSIRSFRNQESKRLMFLIGSIRNRRNNTDNIREEGVDKEKVFHAPIFLEQERKKVVTFSRKIVHFTHTITVLWERFDCLAIIIIEY